MKFATDKSISGAEYKQMLKPFVYGWCRKGVYLYIGATRQGWTRLMKPHNIIGRAEPLLDDDYIDFWFCDDSQIYKTEAELILLHQPKYNAMSVGKMPSLKVEKKPLTEEQKRVIMAKSAYYARKGLGP